MLGEAKLLLFELQARTQDGGDFLLLQKRCPSLGVGANFVRRCKMQHRWVTLSSGDEGFYGKVEEKSMENREVQSFWGVGL